MNRRRLLALLAVAPFATSAFAQQKTVVVGGKTYTEQMIEAETTSQLLRAKGFTVDTRTGLGTAALRQAQESGQIDIYWEYTGTSLITFNKIKERLTPEASYAKVKELDAAKGLVWLNPAKANSSYALAMRADAAKARNIATISDLAKLVGSGQGMRFACNAEFIPTATDTDPFQHPLILSRVRRTRVEGRGRSPHGSGPLVRPSTGALPRPAQDEEG